MREVAFIKQNKEKWQEIERVIEGREKKNPDDLSSLYINLINDLSFAQTYYPKSKTTVYINYLSSRIFQQIYKTKREERNRLLYFYKTEIPLLMYQYRKYLLYAFGFFSVFTLIGAVSAHYDKDFVNLILGDGYVNMTIENIKNKNEVGVYQDEGMLSMSLMIIVNNLRVGAYLFVMGVLGGAGSVFVLFKNCIMLGSFQYLFFQYGDFQSLQSSARGIWIHGVFEIFAMVIEAAAGMMMGASLLFPKTYSRFNSFKYGAKNAFKIFVSTVPFTIFAGILEGFVTRHALTMPFVLNMFIIFGTLVFITYYYCVYPYIVNRKINKNDAVL